MRTKEYLLLFGDNKFLFLRLFFWGWLTNRKLFLITQDSFSGLLIRLSHISFLKRYIDNCIGVPNVSLGMYKGLWYQVNNETLELTEAFYTQKIKTKYNDFIGYYNKFLNTQKFECYIRQQISLQMFAILKDLHLVRLLSLNDKIILTNKTPVYEFAIRHMEQKYGLKYQTKYVWLNSGLSILWAYYNQLFHDVIRRGLVFNKTKKSYKIAKEATWGFHLKTLRDDILIDGKKIGQKDMVLLEFNPHSAQRIDALRNAQKRGYDIVSVPNLKINVRDNIHQLIFFYVVVPLRWYFQLCLRGGVYLFYFIYRFHKRCLPIELFMNLYDVKCNLSVVDHGDIETTIILNKYGAQNVILHWSDMTPYRDYFWAFVAHNIYFVWGSIHYDYNRQYYGVDQKISIGCIFKEAYRQAVHHKSEMVGRLKLNKCAKTVAFFDTSFSDTLCVAKPFFLEYMEMINEFCHRNKTVNVLLKPKCHRDYILKMLGEEVGQYERLWQELNCHANFRYLDHKEWSVEDAIALADVSINMGMTSPATIALICGQNALYYDKTGNQEHPFARQYRNEIVFDDKKMLFQQIQNILNGEFNCRDVIPEEEIRQYDAFDDDKALERLRGYLYKLVSGDPLTSREPINDEKTLIDDSHLTSISETSVG